MWVIKPLPFNELFRRFIRLVVVEVDDSVRNQSRLSIRKNVAKFGSKMTVTVSNQFEAAAELRKPKNVQVILYNWAGPGVLRQVEEPLLTRQIWSSEGEHFTASQSSICIVVQSKPVFFFNFFSEGLIFRQMEGDFGILLAAALRSPLSRPRGHRWGRRNGSKALVPSHLFRLFLFPTQVSFQMMVPEIKAFWQEPNLKEVI